MSVLLILGTYVIFAGLGVATLLLGKAKGNSLYDRLYQTICVQGVRLVKKFLEKAFGKRAPDALDKFWNYLCFSSNPAMQLFYLLVIGGCFTVFVFNCCPHIPSRMISSWHRYTGLGIFLACITFWWRACSADPGIVTRLNVDELCKTFEWDEQIYSSKAKLCKTCNLVKPARSKHCDLCGICVARFDHHCLWMNACIGIQNHKWFLGFLFWHLVLCMYQMYIGMLICYQQVQDKELFKAVFVNPTTKERHEATYLIVLQYMWAKESMLMFVDFIVSGVMGFVVFALFLWHMNQLRTGTTTNEVKKWGDLRKVLKKAEGDLRKKGDLSEDFDFEDEFEGPPNQYDKGCIANFREVFFNLDVHNMPRSALPSTEAKLKKN